MFFASGDHELALKLHKPVPSKPDEITALKEAIWNLHQCRAAYLKSEHVHETFQGKTLWNGDVAVFSLIEHPKALRAYAWADPYGKGDKIVVVLGTAPIKDAKTAVQVSILAATEPRESQPRNEAFPKERKG